MTRIKWTDLDDARPLTEQEMSSARGGAYPANAFSRYYYPSAWGLQNSRINRSPASEVQNSNLISFLES